MSGLRSTSSASVGAGIVIKFELQRTKEVELRRLRGDFTFDELLSAVSHMWGSNAPKYLSIEYVDDEGDRVKIGSEEEWNEAVTQHTSTGAAALRLYIRRSRKQGSRKTDEAASGSDGEAVETPAAGVPVAAMRTASARVEVPALKLPTRAAEVAQPQPVAVASATRAPTVEESLPEVETGDASQAAVVDLLARLYDCDAGREMMNMFSVVDFAPVVRRRLDAMAGEVLVDVDNVALRHLTISRTNMWIGQGLYEKAESTLEAALQVWPSDQVLEYNGACSAALRGDIVKALSMLESAVRHGYSDMEQLKTDADLASIRGTGRFDRIVASMTRATTVAVPTAVAPVEAVTEVERVADPPAAVAVPAPTAPAEKWDPVATLMAMFPQLSAEAAGRVLKRNGDDLAKAASSLLC